MSSLTPVDPLADLTSLAAGDYTTTKILNDVFALLKKMTTSIQNVAAVQAQRLAFYSDWQKYYTDLMAKVPNVDSLTYQFTNNSTLLQKAENLNSNVIQTMQNRQSVVGDETKAMQTVVNQSNDAATSQADLGSSILQELGTLLPIVMGR